MNVERDFSRRNPDFDPFSQGNTLFSKDEKLENEIKLAIQEVFLKNNIDLEYNPVIHQFLRSSKKNVMSIAYFLNNSEAHEVRTVIRALKQEKIKSVADRLLQDYELEFEPFGVTKSEFSQLLQTTSLNPLKEVIEKVGEGKVKKEQSKFNNSYITDFKKSAGGQLLPLLFGKINPELKEKIKGKEAIQSVLAEFELKTGDLRKEVLMASEFNSLMYPVNAEFYWPPLKEEYSDIMNEKILETFDIDNTKKVIEAIMSAKHGTVAYGSEADKIKALYKGKFNSDTENFLSFISEALIKAGNPTEAVDFYIQTIRAGLEGSFSKSSKEKEEKRDALFLESASYFDSKTEKEIVDLIRNEFNLACVASAIKFPITNDFTMNKENFITDFVIYCDGVEFQEKEKDGEKYQVPVIKHRLLLIGEYYGYDSVRPTQALEKDLINPDGTPFIKKNGMPALKGDILDEGEKYQYKTKYKIVTNNFCGRAIGCKTISLNKAESKVRQKSEVARGLDENMVLYNTSFNDVEIKSTALLELIKWYKNASDFEKQEYRGLVEKYFNPDTLAKKPGSEYPLSLQNPKSRYLSKIYETIHLVKSKDLFIAIQLAKKNYSAEFISNEENAKQYLASIRDIRYPVEKKSQWRTEILNNLFKEIKNIPVINGELATPINNMVFLKFLKDISDYDPKNPYDPNNPKRITEYPNIYEIKKAFNYLKAIKRGIIN